MSRSIEVRILGDASQLERAFGKAGASATTFEGRMRSIGASMTATGRSMTHNVTLPILAVAAAAAKMSIDFHRQMLLVQTQAGASAAEMKKMTGAVLELAKTTSESPDELAKGLYHLESVGLRGSQALRTLKTSADAAGMGIADLETVTSALGAAVTSGIKGSQNYQAAMGTLNATVGAGNMRMEDLAGSLGNVLSVAKGVGISLPELGAAMAVLTDRGMDASEAASRLRMTFALMENPTLKARKALSDLGISGEQLAETIRTKGLGAALELLQAGMVKLGDKTRATQDLLAAFGGGRSGTAVLTLVQSLTSGVSSYGQKLDQIKQKTSTFTSDVEAYHQSAAYKIGVAWSTIQADMIKAGDALAPIAVKLANGVATITEAFDHLSPAEKHVVTDVAAVVAVMGPAILVAGKLAKSIAQITAAARVIGLATATTEIAAAGGASATAAVEVSALRVALMRLGALGIITVGIVVTEKIVSALLAKDSHVSSIAPGTAGTPGGVGSGAMGSQIFQRGGKWYQTMRGFRGGSTREITPEEAAALSDNSARANLPPGAAGGIASQPYDPAQEKRARQAAADAAAKNAADAAAKKQMKDYLDAINAAVGGLGTVGGSPPGGSGGGHHKAKKPKILRGSALIPPALEREIEEAASSANAAQGTVALSWLKREKADLERAKKAVEVNIGKGSKAQQEATKNELATIDGKLKSVGKQIRENLKQQAEAIKASFASKISTDQSAMSSMFGRIKSDLDAQLQEIFQDQIAALGKQYFQGGPTPLEAQLAAMQQQDQVKSLQDNLKSATTPEEKAAAQRAIDEYNLQTRAAAERANADRDYAAALKQLQRQQSLTQERLDDQLDKYNAGLLDGTAKIGDLNGIAATFGLSLDGMTDPTTQLGYDFQALSAATQVLAMTLAEEALALAGIGDGMDASKIQAVIDALGRPAGSVYGTKGAGEGYRLLNAPKMAAGGIVLGPTIAMIGEAGPEAVIPLDYAGISGDRRVEIHFHGGTFIGSRPEQVARELKPHIDRVIQSSR